MVSSALKRPATPRRRETWRRAHRDWPEVILDELLGIASQGLFWSAIGVAAWRAMPIVVGKDTPVPEALLLAYHFYNVKHLGLDLTFVVGVLILTVALGWRPIVRRLQEDMSVILYGIASVTVMLDILLSHYSLVLLPSGTVLAVVGCCLVLGLTVAIVVERIARWRAKRSLVRFVCSALKRDDATK